MDEVSSSGDGSRNRIRGRLASLGGTLELYDLVVFGIFARDIGNAVFPAGSPLVSLIAAFAAFAVGYVARPVSPLDAVGACGTERRPDRSPCC
jgi:hypothetical protein